MAWKQDLAKLKQQLGPEDAPPPPPKPAPKPPPAAPSSLDDEDAVFLYAMGQKAAPARPAKSARTEAPKETAAAPESAPETFEEALKDLKGLKPLARGLQTAPSPQLPSQPPAVNPPAAPAGPPPEALQPTAAAEPAAPRPEPGPVLPLRFQLAAGMALEVDGMLDLRSHSVEDAMERLKDRLGDGLVLGWRSLQVILGPDPKLHEGLLALLASGQAPMVARYAQAPVPMGGSQAWLLYLAQPAQP